MPFAGEYREGMGFPNAGDVVHGLRIEQVRVDHAGAGPGRYEYPTEIIVSGEGGKAGVRRALKELFDRRRTIFSGYGNPYQCTGGRMDVEALGARRYRVTARGVGTRVHLVSELERFLGYLAATGRLGADTAESERHGVVTEYLRRYREDARQHPTAEPT